MYRNDNGTKMNEKKKQGSNIYSFEVKQKSTHKYVHNNPQTIKQSPSTRTASSQAFLTTDQCFFYFKMPREPMKIRVGQNEMM